MTWLTIWLHTLFGKHGPGHPHVSDPDLDRARQIKQEQENRLRLIEQEVESFRWVHPGKGQH